jgi:hypothetical protein
MAALAFTPDATNATTAATKAARMDGAPQDRGFIITAPVEIRRESAEGLTNAPRAAEQPASSTWLFRARIQARRHRVEIVSTITLLEVSTWSCIVLGTAAIHCHAAPARLQ